MIVGGKRMNAFGPNNLGVYVCSHVFRQQRPILLVSHADGDWQFLCGGYHEDDELPHVVGIGHLIARDHTLEGLASLPVDADAERESVEHQWVWSGTQPAVQPEEPV